MPETIQDFQYNPDCRYFNGYKPCTFKRLCKECPEYSPKGTKILLINLDAMGDVLMTTAMLKPLKRKYPDSHITWVTRGNALCLLQDTPLVDRVMAYDPETCIALSQQEFDAAFNCDKAADACALLNAVHAKEKFGFGLSDFGTIVPVNPENAYNFELGLNDELKFRKNTQTGQQILHEGMGLEYKRDEYILVQTDEEKLFIEDYRKKHNLEGTTIIGINTGCAPLYKLKKLTFNQYIELADLLAEKFPQAVIALVGGKAETEFNEEIAHKAKRVHATPTTFGLRTGIGFIDLCDVLITGDTLALHIGIALRKFIIALFTLTCPQEIDLYNRGVKIIPPLDCSPCWKRDCEAPRCISEMDLDKIVDGVQKYENQMTDD